MKMKNILPHIVLFIAVGCTIIEDDYLDDLPSEMVPNRIDLVFDYVVSGEDEKVLSADIIYAANKIEINWPEGVNVFFLNKNAKKTVYQLNPNGFADKITTTFTDGTFIEDVLTYNANKQVVELTNSYFKDNLKLFYKNNVLDSVAKTRSVSNTTIQKGFYKRVDQAGLISVFPYDNTKPYNKNFSTDSNCSLGGSIPANLNTLNKTDYKISPLFEDSDSLDLSIKIAYNQISTSSSNCANEFGLNLQGNLNYFNRIDFYYTGFGECTYSSCGYANDGYLNSYLILPTVVPDYLSLYILTAENEVKWIAKNSAKSYYPWEIRRLRYGYVPTTK